MRPSIYKFRVVIDDEFQLMMPQGARLLSVQVQRGEPALWAVVDTEALVTLRRFVLCSTGYPEDHAILDVPTNGTFQLEEGALVYHLFDGGEVSQ